MQHHFSVITVGHAASALFPGSISAYPTSFTSVTVPLATMATSPMISSYIPLLCLQVSQCTSSITVGHVLSELSSGDISVHKSGPEEIKKLC